MELPESGIFSTLFAALLRPCCRSIDRPSLPRYRGELVLGGLRQKVTVRWDRFAVPRVLAADEPDLFFAQGFLHAQERLWQMEMSRRFLAGRTAEIFGDFALPWKELSFQFRGRTAADLDHFVRLLGIRTSARASLGLLSDHLRLCLDAYCGGVNRYIEQCGNRLPWEFRLLRHRPEPWRPEDTLVIGKGLAFLLSTALYTRLNFIALAERLRDQPDKLRALFPSYPDEAPVTARAVWDQARELWRFYGGALAVADWHPAGIGSNAWVIGPDRSQTGSAMLANDPHLRMSLPSLWYLMHLKAHEGLAQAEPYEVWGASIPGCPLIQLGRNRHIAWGITAAVCDDVEIYRERLHPLEPDRYLAGVDWRTFETTRDQIGIRRSAARDVLVRTTHHGPVISDFTHGRPRGEVLSVRWTAHEPSEEMRALYGINRAADWEEFQRSLRHHTAPTLNFLYADTSGNIGYSLAGRIPLRSAVPTLLPLPGWQDSNEWRGYIPFDDLPRLYNPPEGFIASANNRVTDAAYPFYLSHFFEPPYRIRRIHQRVQERKKLSAEDHRLIQLDHVSLHAIELIELLKDDLAQASASDPALKSAADCLLAWDGNCGEASVGAAIFHVWHHRLLCNLLSPDLGEELFSAYVEILNQCITPTDRIFADPGSVWFARRPRPHIVATSLGDACAELEAALGTDMSEWHWGKIHRLHLNHALGRLPIFKPLLGIGPMAAPGDGTTVNLGFYRHSSPYAQTVGASLRFLCDMGTDSCRVILPSGQSGHPFSPHYRDQTALWGGGDTLGLAPPIDEASDLEGVLLLTPL